LCSDCCTHPNPQPKYSLSHLQRSEECGSTPPKQQLSATYLEVPRSANTKEAAPKNLKRRHSHNLRRRCGATVVTNAGSGGEIQVCIIRVGFLGAGKTMPTKPRVSLRSITPSSHPGLDQRSFQLCYVPPRCPRQDLKQRTSIKSTVHMYTLSTYPGSWCRHVHIHTPPPM
jgi:hypothetical protein